MARRTKATHHVTTHAIDGTSGKATCVIYNRVSTIGKQDPHKAMSDLKRAAEQRGYHVLHEVTEHGSGAKSDRAGLQEVMSYARRGEVSAIFVTKLDRFGRSTIDLLSNIRLLTSYGARFACTEQSIDVRPDGSDPMGALLITILAAVAEFERTLIVERVVLGQRRARREGKVLGRPRADGPTSERVRALRAKGKSWSEVAEACGCTPAMARRRFDEQT